MNKLLCKLCVTEFSTNEGRVDDGKFVTTPHFVGKSILLYGERQSSFPYHAFIGPDWGCMLITYCLIVIPTFFFLFDVGSIVGSWALVVGIFLFLVVIA